MDGQDRAHFPLAYFPRPPLPRRIVSMHPYPISVLLGLPLLHVDGYALKFDIYIARLCPRNPISIDPPFQAVLGYPDPDTPPEALGEARGLADTPRLDISGGRTARATLDGLGPLVAKEDGSLGHIRGWSDLSVAEQDRIYARLARRSPSSPPESTSDPISVSPTAIPLHFTDYLLVVLLLYTVYRVARWLARRHREHAARPQTPR